MPGIMDYLQGAPLSSDPDRANAADGALWSLAAGLIGGRGAAGPIIGNAVQGAMGAYQGLLGDALKRRYVQSQIAENASQAEARKQKMTLDQRDMDWRENFLRMHGYLPPGGGAPGSAGPGPGTSLGVGPGPGTSSGAGPMPGVAPAGGQSSTRFPGVPNDAVIADVIFNKGQNLGGLIAKGAEPKLEVHGGEVRDMRTLQPGTLVDQIDRQGRVIRGVRMPDGSVSYQPAPGSLQTYGAFEGANARAGADYRTQDVTLPDGRTVRMTEAQIADMARRGSGTPPAAGQNAPGSTIVPSVASTPMQPMPPDLEAQFRAAMSDAGSTDPNTRLKGMSAAHNIAARARSMGYSLPGDTGAPPQVPRDQQTPRGPALPGVEVQSPAAAERAKTTATGQANRFVDLEKSIAAAGTQATSMVSKIQRARQLFEGLDGGTLTPIAAEFASAAASLGVKVNSKWDNAQAAAALSEGMAMQFRPSNSGAVSDADLASFQKQVPTLAKTPQGRAQIMRTLEVFAQRDQKVAEMARQYRMLPGKGALDDEWEQRLADWTRRNPLQF